MEIINLSQQNSLLSEWLHQLRDQRLQLDQHRFRHNLERIGQIMAYEVSKRLSYTPHDTTTCNGVAHSQLISQPPVLATILRAGLPLHQGLLSYFDNAENAFVSAYRKYHTGSDEFDIQIEYNASPRLDGKTLILTDTMLATGASMELAYRALLTKGTPAHTHLVAVISSQQAVDYIARAFSNRNATLWVAVIDPILNSHAYIVPGLGDAGDLAFGEKEE